MSQHEKSRGQFLLASLCSNLITDWKLGDGYWVDLWTPLISVPVLTNCVLPQRDSLAAGRKCEVKL